MTEQTCVTEGCGRPEHDARADLVRARTALKAAIEDLQECRDFIAVETRHKATVEHLKQSLGLIEAIYDDTDPERVR